MPSIWVFLLTPKWAVNSLIKFNRSEKLACCCSFEKPLQLNHLQESKFWPIRKALRFSRLFITPKIFDERFCLAGNCNWKKENWLSLCAKYHWTNYDNGISYTHMKWYALNAGRQRNGATCHAERHTWRAPRFDENWSEVPRRVAEGRPIQAIRMKSVVKLDFPVQHRKPDWGEYNHVSGQSCLTQAISSNLLSFSSCCARQLPNNWIGYTLIRCGVEIGKVKSCIFQSTFIPQHFDRRWNSSFSEESVLHLKNIMFRKLDWQEN